MNNSLIDIDVNRDIEIANLFTCSICMEEIDNTDKCITNCNHEFCKKCLHDWFGKKKITCPTCRQDIKEYIKNDEKNHIVEVKSETVTDRFVLPIENEILLRRLQLKIYKLNIFICFNISYILYNVYLEGERQLEIMYYKDLYNNCSAIINDLRDSLNDQSEILVYGNNEIEKCYFPTLYVNKCLS